VDLASLGSGGYRIDGGWAWSEFGEAVANAGDVNGDGRPDQLIGAPADGGHTGAAFVVFGQSGTGTIDVASLGSGGYWISGAASGDELGWAVAGAGDLNGDGKADQVLGAVYADSGGRTDDGAVYVVFGKATTGSIDLSSLGAGGYAIEGEAAGDQLVSVADAGDLNADGIPDQLIGAPLADHNGTDSGSAYVVFGKTSTATIDLAALGDHGFRIDGEAAGDQAGSALAGLPDVNGDGIPDLLIGAPESGHTGWQSGSTYVVTP
jgi:hypothetical protein